MARYIQVKYWPEFSNTNWILMLRTLLGPRHLFLLLVAEACFFFMTLLSIMLNDFFYVNFMHKCDCIINIIINEFSQSVLNAYILGSWRGFTWFLCCCYFKCVLAFELCGKHTHLCCVRDAGKGSVVWRIGEKKGTESGPGGVGLCRAQIKQVIEAHDWVWF